jgi:hypothetical protein
MSIHRAAAKVDKSQLPIVHAIEAEGWDCWLIRLPCDLLCWHPVLDVTQLLEVKNAARCTKAGESWDRGRQDTQQKFLRWTSTPVVTSAEQAIAALAKHYPAGVITAELAGYCHQLREQFEIRWKENPKTASSAASLVEMIDMVR